MGFVQTFPISGLELDEGPFSHFKACQEWLHIQILSTPGVIPILGEVYSNIYILLGNGENCFMSQILQISPQNLNSCVLNTKQHPSDPKLRVTVLIFASIGLFFCDIHPSTELAVIIAAQLKNK